MDNWKLLYEFADCYNGLYLPNDKIYVNDNGDVKFNDIVLSLDYGLYITNSNKQYDILMPGFQWPYQKLYRAIYSIFVGDIKAKQHIHHIDGNHLNNNINNLVQVTSKEHRKLHKTLCYKYEDNIDELIAKSIIGKKLFKQYLKERYNEYIKQQKQQEIEEKLKTGLYQLDKCGTLCRTTTAKKGYVTPEETKDKISIKIKELWEDPEYRNKIVEANKKSSTQEKKDKLKKKQTGAKLVIGDDGKRHWVYAN